MRSLGRCVAIGCLVSLACSTSRSEHAARQTAPIRNAENTASRVVLEPPGQEPVEVQVEIARTEQERARGLMFRKQLPENHGMLFVFDRPEHLSFWMKNTYLPLDMVFITDEMRVLGVVENATPLSTQSQQVPGNSQFVLEVNAGFCQAHGVRDGSRVRFLNIPLS